MTQQEKFAAILERLKETGENIEEGHISAMVIIGYLDDLTKEGLIESAWNITPTGQRVRSICDEFEWKPSDDEIKAFVIEMIEPKERAPFMFMIKKYIDDREGLLKDFKQTKETLGNEPPTVS